MEASARIIIDKLLRESGWVLPGDDGKEVFESYASNSEYRKIVDSKKLIELQEQYPGAYEVFKNTPKDLREKIPQFIKEKVNLERLSGA